MFCVLCCCVTAERLVDFTIALSNQSVTDPAGPDMAAASVCAIYPCSPPGGSTVTILCRPGTLPGRYLSVQLAVPNYLALCEVQVFV